MKQNFSETSENALPSLSKIGLGGGCHWCTEGIFESLTGVLAVNQGWIAPIEHQNHFSEAIEVLFDPEVIGQHDLINIHLHTHAASSDHSMRHKYRSAVYVYSEAQFGQASHSLSLLTAQFQNKLITKVYRFDKFRRNKAELQHYFFNAPERPFCQTYIQPKLQVLLNKFTEHLNCEKLSKAGINIGDSSK